MASLTIRNLEESLKASLRLRAAHHGRSMEEEARQILRQAVMPVRQEKGNLAQRIHLRFASIGVDELPVPARHEARQPPTMES